MKNKVFLGIAALILLLIAAGGFIYWQWSQVQQLKQEAAQNAKLLEEKNGHIAKAGEKPPDDPGFKWVQHGDHWDKVPIADVSDRSEQQTDADQQVLSVDAASIRSLILDTLQKTEQELTEAQRAELKRVLDYVQQNGLTKAQLEQLKQSLAKELVYEAKDAAEKAEHAKIHARNIAYSNLLKKANSVTEKLAAINRERGKVSKKLEAGILPTREEYDRFHGLSKQTRQLLEEYNRFVEEYNAKYNNGN